MAESKSNLATEGLSGQVGNFVFRRRKADGKVFVSVHPSENQGDPTEAQQKVRSDFQEAVIYGKSVNADPVRKAAYAEKASPGQSAYNVAVADYFNAPSIHDIDLSNYNGQVGSIIRIKVTDDFKVAKVQVKIANTDGSEVEVGEAVLEKDNNLYWLYTATKLNASPTGDKITVTAWDNPGNSTVKEKEL
ncbi:MAG TPA: hypothetical protein VIK29_04415 [Paludibacter sp.]